MDFCTPIYIIARELGMDKLRVGWGIRAVRFEEKIINSREGSWLRECWGEKEEKGWSDRYGKEREKYYNRNEWDIGAIENLKKDKIRMEEEILNRERDIQRQWEDSKIRKARYNVRYKEIGVKNESPNYLRKENLVKLKGSDGVRALIKLRLRKYRRSKYILVEGRRHKVCVLRSGA